MTHDESWPPTPPKSSSTSEDNANLSLPDLGDQSDFGIGVGDSFDDLNLEVSAVSGDPFDDEVASDVAIEIKLATIEEGGSAIGDDTVGVVADADDSNSIIPDSGIPESSASLIGDDVAGIDSEHQFLGDETLGSDPFPREVDDGGLEGLDDPAGAHVDASLFPPLDRDEDGDRELELDDLALEGMDLPIPEPEPGESLSDESIPDDGV